MNTMNPFSYGSEDDDDDMPQIDRGDDYDRMHPEAAAYDAPAEDDDDIDEGCVSFSFESFMENETPEHIMYMMD